MLMSTCPRWTRQPRPPPHPLPRHRLTAAVKSKRQAFAGSSRGCIGAIGTPAALARGGLLKLLPPQHRLTLLAVLVTKPARFVPSLGIAPSAPIPAAFV